MIQKIKEIYKKNEEIWNYLVVGGLTTLVSLLTYLILTRTILNVESSIQLQAANILKWVAGVLFAYFTNRKFVFKSTNENRWKEFISFTSSRVVTLLMDMAIMGIMVTLLKIYDLIAITISMIVQIVGNYILSKFFVFKKH